MFRPHLVSFFTRASRASNSASWASRLESKRFSKTSLSSSSLSHANFIRVRIHNRIDDFRHWLRQLAAGGLTKLRSTGWYWRESLCRLNCVDGNPVNWVGKPRWISPRRVARVSQRRWPIGSASYVERRVIAKHSDFELLIRSWLCNQSARLTSSHTLASLVRRFLDRSSARMRWVGVARVQSSL